MPADHTRVVVADDDVLLREGLVSLLERSGFVVVGQCGEASMLLAYVRKFGPDLVIVDIRMPPGRSARRFPASPCSSCPLTPRWTRRPTCWPPANAAAIC